MIQRVQQGHPLFQPIFGCGRASQANDDAGDQHIAIPKFNFTKAKFLH